LTPCPPATQRQGRLKTILRRADKYLVSVSVRLVYSLIVIGTTIWVGVDASNLGFRRGRLGGGLIDMGVAAYVICCLLLWIISFPCYLVARGRYKSMYRRSAMNGPALFGLPPQQSYQSATPFNAYPPAAPPQISPDGRWWWNGQQWVAMASPVVDGQPGGRY
jgi:hypothetical protein